MTTTITLQEKGQKDKRYRQVAMRQGMILAVEAGGENEKNYQRLIDLVKRIKKETDLKPHLVFSGIAGLMYEPMIEAKVRSVLGFSSTSIWTIARLWNINLATSHKHGRRIEKVTVRNEHFTAEVDAYEMTITIMLKVSCPIDVFQKEGGKP